MRLLFTINQLVLAFLSKEEKYVEEKKKINMG